LVRDEYGREIHRYSIRGLGYTEILNILYGIRPDIAGRETGNA